MTLSFSNQIFILLFTLISVFFTPCINAEEPAFIAAASSVKFALKDIADSFYTDTGKQVQISYGSSGSLTRQIQQGGPFELFLSANSDYVAMLNQQHKTLDHGIIYAFGRLVMWTKKNSSFLLNGQLDDLKKALQGNQLKHLAIANPKHAPYGVAAQEVLLKLGLSEIAKPRLVMGENIAQAAQFANSGAAQIGLISYSLSLAPALKVNSRSILIPSELHQPLQQTMVLLNNAGETAKLFFNYLQQQKAQNILSHYGYTQTIEN